MADCPAWRPDCQIGAVMDTAADVMEVVHTTGRIVGGSIEIAGKAWGAIETVTDPIGGPLMGFGLVWLLLGLWLLWKLLGAGKQAAPAVIKGYTGVDIGELRKPKQSGQRAGERLRQRVERAKGPTTQAHLGQGAAEIIDRADDRQGRPVRVTVCAADAGAAVEALGVRMSGHTWQHAGSKRCPLGATRKHFTMTKRGTRR